MESKKPNKYDEMRTSKLEIDFNDGDWCFFGGNVTNGDFVSFTIAKGLNMDGIVYDVRTLENGRYAFKIKPISENTD